MIDMVEFSELVNNGYAIKRSFPGATASQLKYYALPTLFEEMSDTVILHVGTNNITKKNQTEDETVKEIIEIVQICRQWGVNEFLCQA